MSVTVGCKLPNGVVLHVKDGKSGEYKTVKLNGFARQNRGDVIVPYAILHGAGMTEVDESFWDAWLKENTRNKWPPLVNGLIFAQKDPREAAVEAKDRAMLKSGLEALDPNKPGAGLEPEEDQAERRRRGE